VSQAAFETHYLRFHRELPVVVRGFSQEVVDHATHGSHRFVHIDASHLYDHVVADIEAARVLMRPDGIVAFDDFREAHTPGVAAAAWGAVATLGLHPVLVTEAKLYATWAADATWHPRVLDWARRTGMWDVEVQSIAGCPVVRLASRAGDPDSRLRRAARAGLPPVVHTGLRRLRDSRRRS
jgi:hypothetical protein